MLSVDLSNGTILFGSFPSYFGTGIGCVGVSGDCGMRVSGKRGFANFLPQLNCFDSGIVRWSCLSVENLCTVANCVIRLSCMNDESGMINCLGGLYLGSCSELFNVIMIDATQLSCWRRYKQVDSLPLRMLRFSYYLIHESCSDKMMARSSCCHHDDQMSFHLTY